MIKNFRITTFIGAMFISACAGIPTVNTETISKIPASDSAFAEARRAVQACAFLPDFQAMFDAFVAMGRRSPDAPNTVVQKEVAGAGMQVIIPYVDYDTAGVIVQASWNGCYVGVRDMTPQQSFMLAEIWAEKFRATTNEQNGHSLSGHVVQAWRTRLREVNRTAFIAAHKTWPWDRGTWPNVPGAAVTLVLQ